MASYNRDLEILKKIREDPPLFVTIEGQSFSVCIPLGDKPWGSDTQFAINYSCNNLSTKNGDSLEAVLKSCHATTKKIIFDIQLILLEPLHPRLEGVSGLKEGYYHVGFCGGSPLLGTTTWKVRPNGWNGYTLTIFFYLCKPVKKSN